MAGNITIELSEILQAKGWTQKRLAEESGVRPTTISSICRGYVDSVSFDVMTKICDALQVSPWSWIIYTSEWMFAEDKPAE